MLENWAYLFVVVLIITHDFYTIRWLPCSLHNPMKHAIPFYTLNVLLFMLNLVRTATSN